VTSRTKRILLAGLVILLAAGLTTLLRQKYFRPHALTAHFSSATGLYPGDEVRIAGVKVGTVRSITPRPDSAEVVLAIGRDIRVPADAKAVIVAQNLVAARYVQLAPLYHPGQPRLADGGQIPQSRTAIPVEWDDVTHQLSSLATTLGPDTDLQSGSAARFIESTANAMAGNGDKLRQTFAQLSALARILSDGSGDIVATIKNLQTFVSALRDSSDQLVSFQDRLSTFSTVLDDSRSDLDAAMSQLAIAVGEVQRFVKGTRDKTAEQVQRLANVTQVLADHRLDIENILHVAPTAFANSYNILNPNVPGALGTFVLTNFSNPVMFICSAIGAIENTTAPETAKLCAQYLGPGLRLLNFNMLPQPPLNPYLMPSLTPDKIVYSDPALAPGGIGGAPAAPDQPPSVSSYTGAGAMAPPPGSGGPPAPAVDRLLLPTEGTPPS
jgi:virulence factor Mce-like protein